MQLSPANAGSLQTQHFVVDDRIGRPESCVALGGIDLSRFRFAPSPSSSAVGSRSPSSAIRSRSSASAANSGGAAISSVGAAATGSTPARAPTLFRLTCSLPSSSKTRTQHACLFSSADGSCGQVAAARLRSDWLNPTAAMTSSRPPFDNQPTESALLGDVASGVALLALECGSYVVAPQPGIDLVH